MEGEDDSSEEEEDRDQERMRKGMHAGTKMTDGVDSEDSGVGAEKSGTQRARLDFVNNQFEERMKKLSGKAKEKQEESQDREEGKPNDSWDASDGAGKGGDAKRREQGGLF